MASHNLLTKMRITCIWLLCIAIALASWRFLLLGVEVSMPFVAYHLEARPVWFYAHVGLAPVALVLMPFQFWQGLRQRHPQRHRWIGRAYGVAILLSGTGGLLMAAGSNSGPLAAWGFGLLAVFWLGFTGMGIWSAIQGRIADHRRWMIRSAALTFAAVTLRLYLPVLFATMGEQAGYVLVSWICWVPNALTAEWFLLRKGNRPEGEPA